MRKSRHERISRNQCVRLELYGHLLALSKRSYAFLSAVNFGNGVTVVDVSKPRFAEEHHFHAVVRGGRGLGSSACHQRALEHLGGLGLHAYFSSLTNTYILNMESARRVKTNHYSRVKICDLEIGIIYRS